MRLSILKSYACCLPLVLAMSAYAQLALPNDLDRDGVPDQLEQVLLEKFRPAFMISPLDCDSRPAEFQPGMRDAIVLDRNGTIYGQVFRPPSAQPDKGLLEIHYYHLWSRDCGKMGHPLDPEYVAALLSADHPENSAQEWRASYWYAAAHEATVCEASSIARAEALAAEEAGPAVFISAGKHGSYFNQGDCQRGCGGDRCENLVPLPLGKLINLGEVGAPMNGAEFSTSVRWPLRQKMQTAFTAQIIANANSQNDEPALARGSNSRVQATISAMGSSLDSAGLGPQHTGAALSTAKKKTRRALDLSLNKVRYSLFKAKQATARWAEKQAAD